MAMAKRQTRRLFLTSLAAAGAVALGRAPKTHAAEGAPETRSVRFDKDTSICAAPQDAAEALLQAEGFTEIRYVDIEPDPSPGAAGHDPIASAMGRGEVDFALNFPVLYIPAMETGAPVIVLAGIHVGCFELFAKERIRGLTELKGKSVGLNAAPPALLTLMAARVGLDAAKDIRLVTGAASPADPLALFTERQIDAFLAYPPEPRELRAHGIGHVIVNTAVDPPWSQYFCCTLTARRDFVRNNPIATKRVLRAVLKAADLCAAEPARIAQRLIDRGFTDRYDYALETLREIPYDKWREYDPEDTMRFYASRLREAGLVKSSPDKIIADSADWRFLDELRRELKT
jgi:NitT/TauT family transport system substrate-binding protein